MTVITAQGVVGAAVDKHTARTALAAEVTWHGWNTHTLSADSTECRQWHSGGTRSRTRSTLR
jgi:hypothetical protein